MEVCQKYSGLVDGFIMINEVKLHLNAIYYLLRNNRENILAQNLNLLISTADEDSDRFIDNIKRLFSGMGSLNDVVLSLNDKPLIEENNQLDGLRRKLYEACISYKYKS